MPPGPEQPTTPPPPDGQQELKSEFSLQGAGRFDERTVHDLDEAAEGLRKQLSPRLHSAPDVATAEADAKIHEQLGKITAERIRRDALASGILKLCQVRRSGVTNVTLMDGGVGLDVTFAQGTQPDLAQLDTIIERFAKYGVDMHYSAGNEGSVQLFVDASFWSQWEMAGTQHRDNAVNLGRQARESVIRWLTGQGSAPVEPPRLHTPLIDQAPRKQEFEFTNPIEKQGTERTKLQEDNKKVDDQEKKKKEAGLVAPMPDDAGKKLRESLEVLQPSDKVIFNESLWARDPADSRWKTSNEDVVLAGAITHTTEAMQGHVKSGAAARIAAAELPLLEKATKARSMLGMTVLSQPDERGVVSEHICNEQAHKFKKLEFDARWRTITIDTNGVAGTCMLNISGNWKSAMQLPGGGQLGPMWENRTSSDNQLTFQRRTYGFDVTALPGARSGPRTINIWGQTLTINVLQVTPGPSSVLTGQRLQIQPYRTAVAPGPGMTRGVLAPERGDTSREEISNAAAGGGAVEIVTNASGNRFVIGKRPGPVELVTGGQRHLITVGECPEQIGYLRRELPRGGSDYTTLQPNASPVTLTSPTGTTETIAMGETKTIDNVTFIRRPALASDGVYGWFEVRPGMGAALTPAPGNAWSFRLPRGANGNFRVTEAVAPPPSTPSAPAVTPRVPTPTPAVTPRAPEAPRVPEWVAPRVRTTNPAEFERSVRADDFCFLLGAGIEVWQKVGEGATVQGWRNMANPSSPLITSHEQPRTRGVAYFDGRNEAIAKILAGPAPAEGTVIQDKDRYSWSFRRFRGDDAPRWGRV